MMLGRFFHLPLLVKILILMGVTAVINYGMAVFLQLPWIWESVVSPVIVYAVLWPVFFTPPKKS